MTNSSDNAAILSIVQKIAADLVHNYKKIPTQGGIYDSKIGLAMFLADYTLHTQDHQFEDVIYQCVTNCLENIGLEHKLSLSGIAGIGWGLNYLVSREVFENDEVAPYLHRLASVVTESLYMPNEAVQYDLMHGFIGKILFLIAQYHNGLTSKADLQAAIRTSLQYLQTTATKDSTGIAWKYALRNDIDYSVGLSHGQPAILMYLCELLYLDILSDTEHQQISEWIEGIIQWILDKREVNDQQTIVYPQTITSGEKPACYNRLAWCYGDFGVAIAFLNAGKLLNNEAYTNEGKLLLLQTTQVPVTKSGIRENPERSSELEMGICHGVAGVAHMFHRFAQVYPEPSLQQSTTHWFDLMLKNAKMDQPYVDWKALVVSEEGTKSEWLPEEGLLLGAIGMGMVLLHDYLMEPTQGLQWDHFLYTDLAYLK
jgi:lantibiotic modifying enzyme